jgi:hypothetical protein
MEQVGKLTTIAGKLRNLSMRIFSSVFKSEALRIAFGVFSFLVLLLFVTPFFFNNSALKFQISQRISKVSGLDLTIAGNVRVALIPSPEIIAENVFLQNYKPKSSEEKSEPVRVYNLYAKTLRIKFPIISFSSDSKIERIIFGDAVVESYDVTHPPLTRENKFTQLLGELKKEPVKVSNVLKNGFSSHLFAVDNINLKNLEIANIQRLLIENGEAIIYDKLGRKKEIKSINLKAKISAAKVSGQGDFVSEDIASNFKFLAKFSSQLGSQNSFLEIISPVVEMRIKGDFLSENRGIFGSDFSGNLDAEIRELKSFYRSYINPNGVIAGKLKYNSKALKVSAKIENKAKEMSLSEIAINSDLISGGGDIEISFADQVPLIDISLMLESLNLDSIWSNEAVLVANESASKDDIIQYDETSETIAKSVKNPEAKAADSGALKPVSTAENQTNFDSQKEEKKIEPINFAAAQKIRDFDLAAEIKIKNIKYLEGDIKDANLYITVSKEGKILILPMIFKIPGEGIFRVNGVLDSDSEAPKFVGKFDASGNNLKDVLKWLKFESQNLKFDSLKTFSFYSDVLLLPNTVTLNNFYLNLNGGKSEFLGNLKIDNSNKTPIIVSDFQVSEFDTDEYFLTSGQNIYLSPGLLVKKLLWLNEISSNTDLNLHFDKMIYKGEEFPNQSVKLRFRRGYLEIADLKLRSKETNLKAFLVMDISDKNPQFNLKIAADNFRYKTEQKSKLMVENNVSEAETKQIQRHNFIDQFFALPSLEGFNGQVAISFDNLLLDDLEVRNFKLAGKLKDGNIENSEVNCSFYNGSPFDYKGLIGIKLEKILNGNLTFSNVSLQQFLPDILGVKNISGIANIAANISGSASKKEEFFKSFVSEIKFSANEPTLVGYGLNDLVKKMFAPQANMNELKTPEKILLNPDAKTIFNQANGTIQFNGEKEGRLRINVSAPAVNGILSGTIASGNSQIEALFNAIFLTGTRQKQRSINIATNLKGTPNALASSINIDQVLQYLGLMKKPSATSPSNSDQNPVSQNPSNIEKSQILPPNQAETPAQNTSLK